MFDRSDVHLASPDRILEIIGGNRTLPFIFITSAVHRRFNSNKSHGLEIGNVIEGWG
jgi:hypothetical protein